MTANYRRSFWVFGHATFLFSIAPFSVSTLLQCCAPYNGTSRSFTSVVQPRCTVVESPRQRFRYFDLDIRSHSHRPYLQLYPSTSNMGVWTRPTEERIIDFQPPPYSDHWHYANYVTIFPSDDEKETFITPEYELGSPGHDSNFLADHKVSPYYDPEFRHRSSTGQFGKGVPPAVSSEVKSTPPLQRRLPGKDNTSCYPSSKKSWLRSIRKRHSHRPNKGPSVTSSPINPSPKFIAIPIP